MAEKKKKGRRAYLDAFQKDEKGNYVYRGELYVWQDEEKKLKQELIRLWGLCILMLVSLAAAGCVEAPGAVNCAYVLIPYTVNFVSGISVCLGLYHLTAGGNPLRAYIYQKSVAQLPGRAVLTAVAAAAGMAGELVFVFRNGMEGKTAGFVFFLLLEAAVLVAASGIRLRVCKMCWKKNP